MTQPVRLKVTATSSHAEKPPAFDMKLLAKRILYRCIPCIGFKSKDEKLPLTPQSLNSNEYDD